jgi:5-methylcytosine-specific restriction endonuclease McrBC regulatory subunit McrC
MVFSSTKMIAGRAKLAPLYQVLIRCSAKKHEQFLVVVWKVRDGSEHDYHEWANAHENIGIKGDIRTIRDIRDLFLRPCGAHQFLWTTTQFIVLD